MNRTECILKIMHLAFTLAREDGQMVMKDNPIDVNEITETDFNDWIQTYIKEHPTQGKVEWIRTDNTHIAITCSFYKQTVTLEYNMLIFNGTSVCIECSDVDHHALNKMMDAIHQDKDASPQYYNIHTDDFKISRVFYTQGVDDTGITLMNDIVNRFQEM